MKCGQNFYALTLDFDKKRDIIEKRNAMTGTKHSASAFCREPAVGVSRQKPPCASPSSRLLKPLAVGRPGFPPLKGKRMAVRAERSPLAAK